MSDKKIEVTIIKYFSRSASIREIMELTEWVNEHYNNLIFKDFVKTNYLMDANMLDFDTEKEKEKILQKIKRNKKAVRKNIFKNVFKYAAIFIVAIGIGYIYIADDFYFLKKQNTVTEIEKPYTGGKIKAGTNKAVLTLENGDEIVLGKEKSIKLKGRSINEEKLVYDSKSIPKKNMVQYNYLTIPKGGRFFVKLSDGTKVWLNSSSKLKYPVSFIEREVREVELMYGEVYFDVSPSTDHKGDTFKIRSGIQEIEVLGTEFNIKAYQDETNIYTTLVEGKVKVSNGVETRILKPSEQSLFNIKNQEITIRKVNTLFDETAWKDGYFSFKHKSMKEIMKILSRWYDIEYVFKDSEKEHKIFTGVLDRESTIDQILIYLQMTDEISFQINNKTVIIE